ncbi:hypothetical protein QR680_001818 [Steinernema hermaphroditum]|uniref:Homeobox domain-containing protein n=1 Tax=Steinernema hermaphroditum TaxID=289476 RepID=A0AA39H228_9BILA|nr:hypothetical protein QR680_001818 [Steinernema hermaphroditum]
MSSVSHEICDSIVGTDNCGGFSCSHTSALSPFDELIHQLHNVISLPPSESVSYAMQANPYHQAMFSVLCDKKLPQIPKDDSVTQRSMEQSNKLDSMIHEFYQFPNDEGASSSMEDDQSLADYKSALEDVRVELIHHSGRMAQHGMDISSRLKEILERHRHSRPISLLDMEKSVEILESKHLHCQNELKQIMCHKLMLNRSKLDESRKKRRNFSKHATQILTRYFNSHVDTPYPSEEDKAKLALECNITVAQVSNWFGNKRIRYKRSLNNISQALPPYNSSEAIHTDQPSRTDPYSNSMYDNHGSFDYSVVAPPDNRLVDYNYNVQMQTFGSHHQMQINDRYSTT